MKKLLLNNCVKGKYFRSRKDMAVHDFDAYKVDDEIHIVYENGNVSTEKRRDVSYDLDKYLWIPFGQFG